jgi:hypothetical protein
MEMQSGHGTCNEDIHTALHGHTVQHGNEKLEAKRNEKMEAKRKEKLEAK